jgi:hypothetical protein
MLTDGTMAPASLERDWMTPDEFRTWFDRLKQIAPDLTQAELGRRLDVKQATISRWMDTGPKGRRIEHGEMLRLALERLATILEEERRPKRRRRLQPEGE